MVGKSDTPIVDREGKQHDFDKVIARIRKLDALTQSSNAGEAANAAAKVQEYLFKFNLSMDDVGVEVDDSKTYVNEPYNTFTAVAWDSLFEWRRMLIEGIARTNFCRTIIPVKHKRQQPNVNIVGRRANIEVVEYLFEYLVREITRLAEDEWNTTGFYSVAIPKQQWRNSFYIGAASAVLKTLREQRAHSERQAGSSGTALATRSDTEVMEALAAFYPNLSKGKAIKVKDATAYFAGREAGASIRISDALSEEIAPEPKQLQG